MKTSLGRFIEQVKGGNDLSKADSYTLGCKVLTGDFDKEEMKSLLIVMSEKGATGDEIIGLATACKENMVELNTTLPVVDSCGTGGDGMNWFNVSTAAALVVASCGVPIAKHGNSSVSSLSGSADVLAELGANLKLSVEQEKHCLEKYGFVFLYAPAHHPGLRNLVAVRKELGIRTIFNLLGPLLNPAYTKRQLIGCSDFKTTGIYADIVMELGLESALIVHAKSGADEIDIEGQTTLFQVDSTMKKRRQTRPSDFGLNEYPRDLLQISSVKSSAKRIVDALTPTSTDFVELPPLLQAIKSAVIINAAATLVAAKKTDSFNSGTFQAIQSIQSGGTLKLLREYINETNSFV